MSLYIPLTDRHDNLFPKPPVKDMLDMYQHMAAVDMTVYKKVILVNGKYLSPVQKFEYEVGYHYYQDNTEQPFTFEVTPNHLEVGRGLHAYTDLKTAQDAVWDMWAKGHKDVQYRVLRCTIPTGSTYFLATDNEICTDNLIIEGEECV